MQIAESNMEIIIYVVTGALVGTFIGWLAADAQSVSAVQAEKDAAAQRYSALEKEFAAYRATITEKLDRANESLREKSLEINDLKELLGTANVKVKSLDERLSELDENRKEIKNTKNIMLGTESLN